MESSASGWRDGERQWQVKHEGGDKGLEHLEVIGSPPPELAPIQDRLLKQLHADPDPCDYLFDVPVDLSTGLVGGFRYDDDTPQCFTPLRSA